MSTASTEAAEVSDDVDATPQEPELTRADDSTYGHADGPYVAGY